MKVLLDTQCWRWMNVSPEKLSSRTHALLMAAGTERLLSVASIWEMGIKYHLAARGFSPCEQQTRLGASAACRMT